MKKKKTFRIVEPNTHLLDFTKLISRVCIRLNHIKLNHALEGWHKAATGGLEFQVFPTFGVLDRSLLINYCYVFKFKFSFLTLEKILDFVNYKYI